MEYYDSRRVLLQVIERLTGTDTEDPIGNHSQVVVIKSSRTEALFVKSSSVLLIVIQEILLNSKCCMMSFLIVFPLFLSAHTVVELLLRQRNSSSIIRH